MGIYFRDILLIRISRGANNCGLHSLEKNSYFTMRFSPHFQLFYFNDRLEFCEFFEWKIKRINNADLFSQPPLLIFIKGANISGGHCILISWRNRTCGNVFAKREIRTNKYIWLQLPTEMIKKLKDEKSEKQAKTACLRLCFYVTFILSGRFRFRFSADGTLF